ncbi:MAG: TolB family protein [Armatimonadota bacterium]
MRNQSHAYALVALLLLATFVMIGCGGDSDTNVFQNVSERVSWSEQGRIAFASYGGNGLLYVYTINEQGRALTLLTQSDNDDDLNDEGGRHPSFSPDGDTLAISARRGETPAIYLIDAVRGDRDAINQVTDPSGIGADLEPSYHPDGDRIVYTSTRRAGNADIRIVNTDGSGNTAVIETDAEEHWAAVSPDGTMLAYQSDAAGNTDIWVKDISALGSEGYDPTDRGTNLTADSPFRNEAPAWSPDGDTIAFHTNRNGDFDIFMMNVDGSEQVAVTADARSDGYPVFSPDGEELAVTRDREIWTVPAQPWTEWRDQIDQLSERLTRRF